MQPQSQPNPAFTPNDTTPPPALPPLAPVAGMQPMQSTANTPAPFPNPIAQGQTSAQAPAQGQPQQTQAQNPSTTPAMADDGDLIEKEWVQKVKQVVQSTTQDPYELSRQFTALKADYMQKRYGKGIKLED